MIASSWGRVANAAPAPAFGAHTLEETAAAFGLSIGQVSAIEKTALRKLRNRLTDDDRVVLMDGLTVLADRADASPGSVRVDCYDEEARG